MIQKIKFLLNYADDLLYALGSLLILIGTYFLLPLATWFVAGAICLVSAYLWSKFWQNFIDAEKGGQK